MSDGTTNGEGKFSTIDRDAFAERTGVITFSVTEDVELSQPRYNHLLEKAEFAERALVLLSGFMDDVAAIAPRRQNDEDLLVGRDAGRVEGEVLFDVNGADAETVDLLSEIVGHLEAAFMGEIESARTKAADGIEA